MLTNYGIRFLFEEARHRTVEELGLDPRLGLMSKVWRRKVVAAGETVVEAGLIADGVLAVSGEPVDEAAIALRYARNPLEHVTRVVFEVTRKCNLRCLHCRNAGVRNTRAQPSERQEEAAAALARMGIRRFDFIGGEVTRYGDGWLKIVDRVAGIDGVVVGVVSNGWFLRQKRFEAAGETFEDDASYARYLRARGVTHVIFSIDGPAELHDRWRGTPGLHARIVGSFDRMRDAGLVPRVSLVLRKQESPAWLAPIASVLYPESGGGRAACDELRVQLHRCWRGRRGLVRKCAGRAGSG